MSLAEIKRKLEDAYNTEDWNLVEDLIDVLDTYITIGEDNSWSSKYVLDNFVISL